MLMVFAYLAAQLELVLGEEAFKVGGADVFANAALASALGEQVEGARVGVPGLDSLLKLGELAVGQVHLAL